MRDFIRGLRNIWYWLPVVWRDRPWDYIYLLKIWRHKVEQMEASTSGWLHVNAEEIREEMQQVIGLLDDLLSDRADMDAAKRHEEIFGKSVHSFTPVSGNPKLTEFNVTYPDADDQEVARKALISLMQIAEMTRKVTLAALGRSVERIDRWWD